jgi:signal transduction histidine kinase
LRQVEQTGSLEQNRPEHLALVMLRAIVGLACLAMQLSAGAASAWPVTAMASLFACYGLLALLFRWSEHPSSALLSLLAQTVFFLVFATYGADYSGWLSSSLFFYLLLLSVFTHQWWDTLVVVGASASFLALVPGHRTPDLWRVVFWSGLVASIGAVYKSRVERRLAEGLLQVRRYRELAESARDAERQKLAGDFHDGPLQAFIGIQLRLEVLKKLVERDPRAAQQELRDLQEVSKSQVTEMRAFLRGIRPVELGEAGLVASLRQIVAEFQKHSGITATFQSSGSPDLASPVASRELVQIVREALTNVQKHSKATRVAVTVSAADGQLEISIEDNGTGFAFSGAYTLEELELLRTGPFSIQKRVRALEGDLVVESRPQRGAGIVVRIPA